MRGVSKMEKVTFGEKEYYFDGETYQNIETGDKFVLKYGIFHPAYLSEEDIEAVGLQFKETIDQNLQHDLENLEMDMYQKMRLKYLQTQDLEQYIETGLTGSIKVDLINTSQMAENFWDNQIELMMKTEGLTDQYKNNNPLEWVQKMNQIRDAVREMINRDIVERKAE